MQESEATIHAVKFGNRCPYRLVFPDLEQQRPGQFWFVLRNVRTAQERERIKMAGFQLIPVPGQAQPSIRVDTWSGFLAKAEAQVVDYRYPRYDDNGEIVGEYQYSRNPSRNVEVYQTLSEEHWSLLTAAMDQLAGRECDPDTQAVWDRLGNEHGPLLTTMPSSDA